MVQGRQTVLTPDPLRAVIHAPSFVWLHLPKTGGTSMNELVRQQNWPDCVVDPDHLDSKHDSIAVREKHSNWRAGGRRRFITARRLDQWLVSDWQHKRRHMGLPQLDFEPVRCGLFYSLRLGGTWVAADWWLQYFDVDAAVTTLRLEHLQEDINRHLLPLLPAGTASIGNLPQANAKPSRSALEETRFTEDDLQRIAAVNPRWSRWEQQTYGPDARP